MVHIHQLLEALQSDSVVDGSILNKISATSKKAAEVLMRLAEDAICFDIGEMDNLPNLPIDLDMYRLPYSVCWFEGSVNGSVVASLAYETPDQSIWTAIFNKQYGIWCCIGTFSLTKSQNKEIVVTAKNTFSQVDGLRHAQYASAIMRGVGWFLMALHCCNVERRENLAPEALNKKRQAKGKCPLYSYWTLQIPGRSSYGAHGGSHQSPRVHLRRGHVRKIHSGKCVWVQPHMVGDKSRGIVFKDYKYAN